MLKNYRKGVYRRLTLSSSLAILISFPVIGMEDEPDSSHGSRQQAILADTKDSSDTTWAYQLERFYEECAQERAIAVKTERTVIAPTILKDMDKMLEMYANKQSHFIELNKNFEKPFMKEQEYWKTELYTRLEISKKAKLKIKDYSIFSLDEFEQPIYIGHYTIGKPNLEGWANTSILLKPEFRGKKFGEEILNAVCTQLIPDVIGTNPYLLRYEAQIGHPQGLYNYKPNPPASVSPEEWYKMVARNPIAKPIIYTLDVTFKGLEGWIQNNNVASIELHKKCGWKYIKSKTDKDIYGNLVDFSLYRFPVID